MNSHIISLLAKTWLKHWLQQKKEIMCESLVSELLVSQVKKNMFGGLQNFMTFHILGLIMPTDSYVSEGFKPPSSNAHLYSIIMYYYNYSALFAGHY